MAWMLKLAALLWLATVETAAFTEVEAVASTHKNAYATMMYMGTPRDYEFYVAIRVLFRSLTRLHVDADLVVIASADVPLRWTQTLEKEDGAKVKRVENLNNPYEKQSNFDRRFKLTMNKIYAWNLVDYERVVMLDADNLFLHNTDELFQCGEFCAVFINPCIFHTGLFVLKPSKDVFDDMVRALNNGLANDDGADQGFIGSYFPDMLDAPLFHPRNGSHQNGKYRLPLGYQMEATYYYLRLRWNVPCGPNSVITFPGAIWLKPWYWWSWPVLPLGLQWHQRRWQTLGYAAEMPMVFLLTVVYLGIVIVSHLARRSFSFRRTDKDLSLLVKSLSMLVVLAAYAVPFFVIPCTIHPLLGWALYLLGAFAVSSMAINVFMLPMLPVLTPWLGVLGVLLVMAYPWYPNGVFRALAIFGYAFCCSPVLWWSARKVVSSLQASLEREGLFSKMSESSSPPSHPTYSKMC